MRGCSHFLQEDFRVALTFKCDSARAQSITSQLDLKVRIYGPYNLLATIEAEQSFLSLFSTGRLFNKSQIAI